MKTEKWAKIDRTLNVLFSFGAAVVIFGAMTKILHWKGADMFLMAGLISEVAIFIIMGVITMVSPVESQMQIAYEKNDPHKKELPYNGSIDASKFQVADIADEMLTLKLNLGRLNQKIDNILKS